MAVKQCCVENCMSSSARKEDHGVTYHKFPKDVVSKDKWQSIIPYRASHNDLPAYVCSRHFCKGDFHKNEDSKYILKSDAVPSIFPLATDLAKMESSQIEEILSSSIGEEEKHVSFERNESTSENLKAIKEFIENEEKKIEEIDSSNAVNTKENADINQQVIDGNYKVASDVMDMILLSDSQTNSSQDIESIHPEHQSTSIQKGSILSSKDKGNGSMSLSIGSKVEVKDFEEDWYCAEIVEVDYEDMEVLIHFQVDWKKPDEWINVGSPRLRPFTGTITKPPIKTVTIKDEPMDESIEEPSVKVEPTAIKMEDKANEFEVGERCLARWRDNRRFVATIHKVLGDGTYEVVFDDGDHWTCKTSRLSKMKSGIADSLKIDTSLQSTSVGSPSPIASGATNAPDTSPLTPAFHTHLFDPARDYLGSKSERREMKRKLNIKEIFNIDQRKYKVPKIEKPKVPAARKQNVKKVPVVKLPKVKLEKVDYGGALKQKIKAGVPDAVASIIGSINKEDSSSSTVQGAKKGLYLNNELNECVSELVKMDNVDEDSEYNVIEEIRPFGGVVDPHCETLDDEEEELKSEGDPVSEEDVVLENFDSQDVQAHAQVLDNIKRAILKIEKGLDDEPATLKIERVTPATPQIQEIKEKTDSEVPKVETELSKTENDQELINLEDIGTLPIHDNVGDISMENLDNEELCLQNDNNVPIETSKKSNKDLATVKKSRKLKLLKRRKAHLDMERVKLELARMKRKYEKMKREMYDKIQGRELVPAPESHLQPHEWCCKWVNGQPVGRVSEIENTPQLGLDTKPALPRRSVEVYDRRIPPGWTKHMVRRSAGHSAGKWHVVLVSPEECGSRKFHTKGDMRQFLTSNADPALLPYHDALMDFGVHLKVSRRMGWIQNTPDGIAEGPDTILPAGSSSVHSPLLKRKKINLKKRNLIMKEKKRGLMKRGKKRRPIKIKLQKGLHTYNSKIVGDEYSSDVQVDPTENIFEQNLMPLEDGYVYVGSLKVQIIENLLRCPAEGCFKNFRTKTLLQMHIKHYHRELTAQLGRTPKVLDLAYARTIDTDSPQHERKVLKVKIHRPQKREEQTIQMSEALEIMDPSMTPSRLEDMPKIPRSLDSPKLRLALSNKPTRGPRVLLPVRRPEPEPEQTPSDSNDDYEQMETVTEVPMIDNELDFETAISTHTVTKPPEKKKKGDKKKSFASFSKNISEDEEMFALVSDDFDTMSSFPRSGTPDSKVDSKMAAGQMSSESNEEQKDHMYTYTETGERIKIEHMKREEIINCHCGVREEDGLMVQCELCLCWQHALCHNIQRETEVPEKYTCSICLNPRRGRRSQRFVHDQDRVYEGALAGAAPVERLRRAHELAANLLLLRDALHALRVKGYVASKKNHPKLYLWASEWDDTAAECSSERVRCEYSDMQVIVNGVGKENRPLRDDPDVPSTTLDDGERAGRDAFGAQCLLSGLLASPGGASLDLALNSSEFDRIANSVQESGWSGAAPQPEAAIENGACRERLLRHARRALARLDLALTYIDAHVTELESQEPTFGEDYETAESYPRTKQTIQMLMRDLDTMEELGVIT